MATRDHEHDGPSSRDHEPAGLGAGQAIGAGVRSSPAVLLEAEATRQLAAPLPPGLYLVATPIGNLADISVRAIATLARADVVLCEDTRHSRILMTHYGIRTPLAPYHEHNAARERPDILRQLADGRRIALISDAGTPLVSDPGYKLVREALDQGAHVESLPGASAALAALTSAGLPTDTFLFAGFLPPRSAARQTRIRALASVEATLVFYEAPSRVGETLADLAAVLGPREAAVARELTKRYEAIERGSLPALAESWKDKEARGEFALLVGPPVEEAASDAAIEQRLAAALETMTLRDAAKAVSEALGVQKSRVYDLGLKLKR